MRLRVVIFQNLLLCLQVGILPKFVVHMGLLVFRDSVVYLPVVCILNATLRVQKMFVYSRGNLVQRKRNS